MFRVRGQGDFVASKAAIPEFDISDLENLVAAYPGPALACTLDGDVLAANLAAKGVLVNGKTERRIAQPLTGPITEIAQSGGSLEWSTSIERAGEPEADAASFLITGRSHPIGKSGENAILVFAWETTFQANLRDALIDSRSFFRSLADCAGDFVWATDSDGKFSYISPSGVGAINAKYFFGRTPAEIFGKSEFELDRLFKASEPVADYDLWLEVDQTRLCFRFVAEPVVDSNGEWTGARGVGRDVTELKQREAELARIRRGEETASKIFQAIRMETDPEAMLSTAARAVMDASRLAACWILRRSNDRVFDAQTAIIEKADRKVKDHPFNLTEGEILGYLGDQLKSGNHDVLERAMGSFHIIAAPAHHGGLLLGAVCFFVANNHELERPLLHRERIDQAHAIAESATDLIASTIGLVEKHDHLKILSHTDSLTGLLNRRAFEFEATRRLTHHRRKGRPAALLYIDLDNFKEVNDTRGHAIGDELLSTVAHIISMNIRKSDLAVRLGGDEFAVWLEEADETAAELKAHDFIEQCSELSELLSTAKQNFDDPGDGADAAEQIGMSIGISIFDPEQSESLQSLLNRADSALYQAKSAGKQAYRVSPPLGSEQADTH